MEQSGEWDERKMRKECSIRQVIRWIAYWRYKSALEERAIEEAKMRHE